MGEDRGRGSQGPPGGGGGGDLPGLCRCWEVLFHRYHIVILAHGAALPWVTMRWSAQMHRVKEADLAGCTSGGFC